jgi:hypothetical protein
VVVAAVQPVEMPDDVRHRYARWRRWRWLLLGVTVAVQLGTVVVTPLPDRPRDLAADLAADRVTAFEVGFFEREPEIGFAFPLEGDGTTSQPGVRWTTSEGLRHQTDLRVLSDQVTDGSFRRLDEAATIRATARAAGGRATGGGESTMAAILPGLAFLTFLTAVLLLITGPEPRRFTRWGTFWLLCLPAGTGIVWWLLREAPWSRAMSAEPAPQGWRRQLGPFRRRRGGWSGFFWLLLIGALAGPLLRAAVPLVLDHHGTGEVTWQLVDRAGRHATLD